MTDICSNPRVYDECTCDNELFECTCLTKYNAITSEIEELNLEKSAFMYCLDELPSDIFSQDEFLIFTLTHTCYCYSDFDILNKKTLYIYVKADYYAIGERITYGKIFSEIVKQVNEQYKEIAEKCNLNTEDLYCNHRFLEGFDQTTPIQYDIFCGS